MDRVPIWSFVWQCIDRAATETKNFWGFDLKTIVTFVVLLVFGFLLQWRVRGAVETKDDAAKWAITIAVPFVIFAAFLVMINLARAPYLVLNDVVSQMNAQVANADRARIDANGERDTALRDKGIAEDKIKTLEGQRKEQHPDNHTKSAEKKSISSNETVIDQLATFVQEGSDIQGRFLAKDDAAAELRDGDEWATRIYAYLKDRLGVSYGLQFKNATGSAWMGMPTGRSVEGGGYWQNIEGKKVCLNGFIAELRTRR